MSNSYDIFEQLTRIDIEIGALVESMNGWNILKTLILYTSSLTHFEISSKSVMFDWAKKSILMNFLAPKSTQLNSYQKPKLDLILTLL